MPLLNNFYLKFGIVIKRFFPKLYCRLFEKSSFAKFFICGFIASAVDLVLLFLFHGLFHWNVVFSTSLAFILSFAVSFYLQRSWTFEHNEGKKAPKELVLYMLNAFLSLNINGFAMHALTAGLHIWYLLAQVIVNTSLGVLNFYISKFIIFRNDDEINCEQEPLE